MIEKIPLKRFVREIISLVKDVGEYCSNFWNVIMTTEVGEWIDDKLSVIDIPLVSDIIDTLIDFVLSGGIGDMLIIEFLLFGGLVTVLIVNIVSLFK